MHVLGLDQSSSLHLTPPYSLHRLALALALRSSYLCPTAPTRTLDMSRADTASTLCVVMQGLPDNPHILADHIDT